MRSEAEKEEFYQAVGHGDEHAVRFVRTFVAYCHLLDDVVDRDQPVDDERLARESLGMMVELAHNPFFVAHRFSLMPLVIAGFNAWLDANRWEKSEDDNTARAADVVKGFYHEVVWHVAYLTGGWPNLRAVTAKWRGYDFDVAAALHRRNGIVVRSGGGPITPEDVNGGKD
ncbi:MAG: hypothetical protein AB1705_08495 [Verrucomicrobiota bacterium]